MKTYINRNANMFLLYWVAILAISLVASGIYFQTKFHTLNTQLVDKSTRLENQQDFLTYVTGELDVKNERERKLLQKFEQVTKDRAQLSVSCQQMEQQLEDAGFVRTTRGTGKISKALTSIFPRDDLGRSY
jgi:hypothetical protein